MPDFSRLPEGFRSDVLHLLRASPRTSYDLDLVPRTPPGLAEIVCDTIDDWNALTDSRYGVQMAETGQRLIN